MARYSIDGQILSDMANAIRANKGEVMPEIITGETHTKSSSGANTQFGVNPDKRYKLTLTVTGAVGSGGAYVKLAYKGSGYNYYYHDLSDGPIVTTEGQTETFFFNGPWNRSGVYVALSIVTYGDSYDATFTLEEVDAAGNPLCSYTPEEMVEYVKTVPKVPASIEITDSGNKTFAGELGTVNVEVFGNVITTRDLGQISYMFQGNQATHIPFDINGTYSSWSYNEMRGVFEGAQNLVEVPAIYNVKPETMARMFTSCFNLRTIPDDFCDTWNWGYIENASSEWDCDRGYTFWNCYSLRSFPMEFLAHGNPQAYATYSNFYYCFTNCYALDEIVNLPNPHLQGTYTDSSMLLYTFNSMDRLKRLTFAPTGPVNWANQTMDLSAVGYAVSGDIKHITNYNSGITADKEVKDAATYQALKDDPDWFTLSRDYSRYNCESAQETLNSLPDTSAFAAENGANTIIFDQWMGRSTDGGAIAYLDEEVIAAAAAKGWTVSLI